MKSPFIRRFIVVLSALAVLALVAAGGTILWGVFPATPPPPVPIAAQSGPLANAASTDGALSIPVVRQRMEAAHEEPNPLPAAPAEVKILNERIWTLERQLERAKAHPEGSPWEAFLHSPESDFILEPKTREKLELILTDIPVYLEPGEATWLANRIENDDWEHHYGPDATYETGILIMVGPERAYRDMSHEELQRKLWAEEFEEEWVTLFAAFDALARRETLDDR